MNLKIFALFVTIKQQLNDNTDLKRPDLGELVVEVGALLESGEPGGGALLGGVAGAGEVLDADTAARCL